MAENFNFENIFQTEDPEENSQTQMEEDIEGFDMDSLLGSTDSEESQEENKTITQNTSDVESDESIEQGSEDISSNLYSSMAKLLKEQGLLSDFTDEEINVRDLQEFSNLLQKREDKRIDGRQKMIEDAVNSGADVDEVTKLQGLYKNFSDLENGGLDGEGEQVEDMRRKIMAYELKTVRGYSDDKIKREIEKSFRAGTDKEDTYDAIKAIKSDIERQHSQIISDANKKKQDIIDKANKADDDLKTRMMDENSLFSGMNLTKSVREKAVKNLFDRSRGKTPLEEYMSKNADDFRSNVAFLFTITDGFKNMDKLVSSQVSKKISSKTKDLERMISGSMANMGNLTFANDSSKNDSGSSFNESKWKLDI